MLGGHHADEPVGEKVLAAVSVGRSATVDHQVERPGVQLVERARVEGRTGDGRMRRLQQNPPYQRGAERRDGVIADAEAKRLGRGRRIEGLRGEQLVQVCDDRRQLGAEALGAWRQRISVGSTHQKFVAEVPAESLQRPAHRGLTEREPVGRARDVTFLQEGDQRRQKVQIDSIDMRFMHTSHAKDSFHKYAAVAQGRS